MEGRLKQGPAKINWSHLHQMSHAVFVNTSETQEMNCLSIEKQEMLTLSRDWRFPGKKLHNIGRQAKKNV